MGQLTDLLPCVVPRVLGLMAGHGPTSCAPPPLPSPLSLRLVLQIRRVLFLGTYGTVSTVKVLPDGHISAPFRFLTFTSIQRCCFFFFCTFCLINIQAQHMRQPPPLPPSPLTHHPVQNARMWFSISVCGWRVCICSHLWIEMSDP